jgi:hypothetical protein
VNIKLHVDRVVLEAGTLAAKDAEPFRAALSRELRRLLSAGGVPSAWRGGSALAEAPGGALTLGPAPAPAQLGAQVARSIVGASGGGT